MIGDREVILFQDARMLDHRPDPDAAFLPGRLDRRVREILSGLGAKWHYPEHPGRLTAVLDLLDREPVPGVRLETGRAATRAELARVHTTSYLDGIYAMRGENAWLDMDTTAVSPGRSRPSSSGRARLKRLVCSGASATSRRTRLARRSARSKANASSASVRPASRASMKVRRTCFMI